MSYALFVVRVYEIETGLDAQLATDAIEEAGGNIINIDFDKGEESMTVGVRTSEITAETFAYRVEDLLGDFAKVIGPNN